MKLAAFTLDGRPELGAVEGDRIVSLSRTGLASDMIDLIGRWPELHAEARRLAKAAKDSFDLAEVRLLPPIARPGKILGMGLNYRDHIEESGMAAPNEQAWFCKHVTAVNGPNDPVDIPVVSDTLDYEVELVAVIGKRARHVGRSDAPNFLFGCCVGNDFSVREWQLRTSQWMLGKSFDGHAPFGPWITTADEVGDPHALDIKCFVNGEMRQSSNTRHLLYDIWDQIAHLNQAMTLEPGDLLFTGTPGGVGWAMEPRRVLRSGDRVRCEIEKLGAIEAEIRQEPAPEAQ